jgi:hypothetical protein
MKNKESLSPSIQRQQELVAKVKSSGQSFMYDAEDEQTTEYAHFYFVGVHEGKEVLFDTVLYTLRMQHESELFEIAEQKAAQHFPGYKKIQYEEDEEGNLKALDDLEEEIGLYMAEVMMELEEEGQVKVKEHVDLDPQHDCGIGLDVGLHIDKITPQIIESFIRDFNADKLVLDSGYYSFQTQIEELKP